MESASQQQATDFYNMLLQSKLLFKQVGQIEFVTQPKEIIYQENKLILYHFKPQVQKTAATPLLIVFALINRPEILDLSPDNSFIKTLLKQGRDVYLVDWGYPSPQDKNLTLSDYIRGYLHNCVKKIKSISRQTQVDLLGVCQGGVLSLCYASLFPQDLRRLVLISTPVDFHTKDDILSRLAQSADLEKFVKHQGNIPGAWLAQLFVGIRPFHLLGKKYLCLLDYLSTDKPDPAWLKQFFLIEKWLTDTPDLVGCAFAEFVQIFYQQNSLVRGKFNLQGQEIDLQSLSLPVLNVMARDDHIVPSCASSALKKWIASKHYSQSVIPGGHIGIYISQKTSARLPKLIASWLSKEPGKKRSKSDNGRTNQRKKPGKNQRVGE